MTDPTSRLDLGTFKVVDQPGKRIQLTVEDGGHDDAVEAVLSVKDSITWWKSLDYWPFFHNGSPTGEHVRLETKDKTKTADVVLTDISTRAVFELWKGGFLGVPERVYQQQYDTVANRGLRLTFHWLED